MKTIDDVTDKLTGSGYFTTLDANSGYRWYRRVLHVLWSDKRTNKSILHEIQPKKRRLTFVRQRKLCYFGHVPEEVLVTWVLILKDKVQGKRSRGRPKATWEDNIKDWTGLRIH